MREKLRRQGIGLPLTEVSEGQAIAPPVAPPAPAATPPDAPGSSRNAVAERAARNLRRLTPEPQRPGEAVVQALPTGFRAFLRRVTEDPGKFGGGADRVAKAILDQGMAGLAKGVTAGYMEPTKSAVPEPLYGEEKAARKVGEFVGVAAPIILSGGAAAALTTPRVLLTGAGPAARVLNAVATRLGSRLTPGMRKAIISAAALGGYEGGRAPEEGESGSVGARAVRGTVGGAAGAALPVAGKAAVNVLVKPPLEALARKLAAGRTAREAAAAAEDPLERLARLAFPEEEGAAGVAIPQRAVPEGGGARLIRRGAPAEIPAPSGVAGAVTPPTGGPGAGKPPVAGAAVEAAPAVAEDPARRAEAFWRKTTPEEQAAKEAAADSIPPPPAATEMDIPTPTPPAGQKERRFITRIREGKALTTEGEPFSPPVRQGVEGFHTPIKLKEVIEASEARAAADAVGIANEVNAKDTPLSARLVSDVEALASKLDATGETDKATDLLEALAVKSTVGAQGLRMMGAFSSSLSAPGIVVYARRIAKRVGVVLTADQELQILQQARKVKGLPPGRRKIIEDARLQGMLGDIAPPETLEKVSTAHTIGMLFTLKGFLRNVLGTAVFQPQEMAAQAPAQVVDRLLALGTKRRTIKGSGTVAGLKGFGKGFVEAVEDMLEGVDTSPLPGRYETAAEALRKGLPRRRFTLTSKPGRFLEGVVNFMYRAMDRPFYQMGVESSKARQIRALGRNPSRAELYEIEEEAALDGLRMVYQDPNAISNGLGTLRRWANANQKFGAGDLLIKFTKTPGGLFKRGIEFSPLGFVESAINLYRFAKAPSARTQKQLAESVGRATVGSGIIGAGYALARMGILTGSPPESAKIREVERARGKLAFALNTSKLKRTLFSGFMDPTAWEEDQPGDEFVQINWMQPFVFPLFMGAEIGRHDDPNESIITRFIDGMAEGTESLVEAPLLTGVRRAAKAESVPDLFKTIFRDAPSSFVPALFGQMMMLRDNQMRLRDDPNFLTEVAKRATAKVPWASETLPEQVGLFGEPKLRMQPEKHGAWEAFVAPSPSASFIVDDRRLLEMDELIQKTGETAHVPPSWGEHGSAGRTQDIVKPDATGERTKQTVHLSSEQMEALNRFVREGTARVYDHALDDPLFQGLGPHDKQSYLVSGTVRGHKVWLGLDDVVHAAKAEVLGHDPEQRDKGAEVAREVIFAEASPKLRENIEAARQNRGRETMKRGPDAELAWKKALRDTESMPEDQRARELIARGQNEDFLVTTQDLIDIGIPPEQAEREAAKAGGRK